MAKAHPFHLVRRSSSAHRSPDPGEGWGRKPLLLHLAAFLLTALALLPVAVCQAQTYTIGEIAVTIVSYEPKQIELKWTTPPNPPTIPAPGTPGPNDPKKVPCGASYGGLHLYMTRMVPPARLDPLCRAAVISASWSASGTWITFNPIPDLEQAFNRDGTLSLVLLSSSESRDPHETAAAGKKAGQALRNSIQEIDAGAPVQVPHGFHVDTMQQNPCYDRFELVNSSFRASCSFVCLGQISHCSFL
jgi:hypothetical protein